MRSFGVTDRRSRTDIGRYTRSIPVWSTGTPVRVLSDIVKRANGRCVAITALPVTS